MKLSAVQSSEVKWSGVKTTISSNRPSFSFSNFFSTFSTLRRSTRRFSTFYVSTFFLSAFRCLTTHFLTTHFLTFRSWECRSLKFLFLSRSPFVTYRDYWPGHNVYKTFYGRNLRIVAIRYTLYVFIPGKLFQPSLMFAGKAGAYPSEAPFRCSTLG